MTEQEHENTKNNGTGKREIWPVILIASTVLVVVIVGLALIPMNKRSYERDYAKLVALMATGVEQAEDTGNLIHDVWYNVAFKVDDAQTDKYTKDAYGDFWYDFNTALTTLMNDSGYIEEATELRRNQAAVQRKMQSLAKAPEGYEEAQKALEDYYEDYMKLVEFSIVPTGSLNSFTADFEKLDKQVKEKYEACLLYVKD